LYFQEFVDCVRERRPPICDAAIGASSVNACQVMNFAYRYGANARWDPAEHRFVNSGKAPWLTRDARNWNV
jgi:hypothetical protein